MRASLPVFVSALFLVLSLPLALARPVVGRGSINERDFTIDHIPIKIAIGIQLYEREATAASDSESASAKPFNEADLNGNSFFHGISRALIGVADATSATSATSDAMAGALPVVQTAADKFPGGAMRDAAGKKTQVGDALDAAGGTAGGNAADSGATRLNNWVPVAPETGAVAGAPSVTPASEVASNADALTMR